MTGVPFLVQTKVTHLSVQTHWPRRCSQSSGPLRKLVPIQWHRKQPVSILSCLLCSVGPILLPGKIEPCWTQKGPRSVSLSFLPEAPWHTPSPGASSAGPRGV